MRKVGNDHQMRIACVPTELALRKSIAARKLADDKGLRGYSVC